MRLFTLIVVLAVGLSLTGCVYVPPVWDIADEIHKVDQIEEGITTREEVSNLLGEPNSEMEFRLTYWGYTSYGFIMGVGVILFVPVAGAELINEACWWIKIDFDENGVVRIVSSSEEKEASSSEERKELTSKEWEVSSSEEKKEWWRRNRAEGGNAEAQFELSLLAQSNKEEWKWLSLAANRGHAIAQGKVGQEYWPEFRSIEIVESDLTHAYMWFSLAATNGHEYARNWRDNLAKTMSANQITEGERLAAEWKPDPGACELEAAASS
jgi:outer membrane protein assembly factor BamE (lipoprotein component of BamABCDE complex)